MDHLDIMNRIGSMAGEMNANFKTLFNQQGRLEERISNGLSEIHDTVSEVRERVAKLEAGAALPAPGAPAKVPEKAEPARIKGWQWAAVGAACVSMLGGLASAFSQIERIAIAMYEALHK